jgi:hypothetical protein
MFIGNHGGTLHSSKLLCFDSKAFQLKEGVFVRLTIPPKWLNGTLHGGFGLLFIVWFTWVFEHDLFHVRLLGSNSSEASEV